MDLINRQTAIYAVNAYGWLSRDGKERCKEILNGLPSAQQWIPCSKELPPYGKHVLTWWKGVIAIDCRVPGYEEYWLLNVEAWMPLPEPYDPLADTAKKQKESIMDKYMRIAKGEIEGYDPSAPCPEPIDVDF